MDRIMDKLTIFGLFSVTAMLATYALEKRSHWFSLAFAVSCVLRSAYGFLQGAWPFGLVEAIGRWSRSTKGFYTRSAVASRGQVW